MWAHPSPHPKKNLDRQQGKEEENARALDSEKIKRHEENETIIWKTGYCLHVYFMYTIYVTPWKWTLKVNSWLFTYSSLYIEYIIMYIPPLRKWTNGTQKGTRYKQKYHSNRQVSGDMLVFRGVRVYI